MMGRLFTKIHNQCKYCIINFLSLSFEKDNSCFIIGGQGGGGDGVGNSKTFVFPNST